MKMMKRKRKEEIANSFTCKKKVVRISIGGLSVIYIYFLKNHDMFENLCRGALMTLVLVLRPIDV